MKLIDSTTSTFYGMRIISNQSDLIHFKGILIIPTSTDFQNIEILKNDTNTSMVLKSINLKETIEDTIRPDKSYGEFLYHQAIEYSHDERIGILEDLAAYIILLDLTSTFSEKISS